MVAAVTVFEGVSELRINNHRDTTPEIKKIASPNQNLKDVPDIKF